MEKQYDENGNVIAIIEDGTKFVRVKPVLDFVDLEKFKLVYQNLKRYKELPDNLLFISLKKTDNLDIVKYLVEEESYDIHQIIQGYVINESLLHVFCRRYNGNIDILSYLLQKLSPNLKDSTGKTALLVCENKKFVDKLLEYKADINEIDNEGNTIMHNWVSEHNVEDLKYLVGKGIDYTIQNDEGYTPYTYLSVVWDYDDGDEDVRNYLEFLHYKTNLSRLIEDNNLKKISNYLYLIGEPITEKHLEAAKNKKNQRIYNYLVAYITK